MCAWTSTKPGITVLPRRSRRRTPAGAATRPRSPTATIRLSVTRTSPLSITWSPIMVMTRAPLSRIEPDGRDRGTSTTTSVFCGSAASTAWRKNCAPHDQVTVRPSRGPGGILAALERHPLHRHRRVLGPALDAHLHRLAAGPRHVDEVVLVLQVDERPPAIGREHDVVGAGRVVTRADALDAQQRAAIEAVQGDRLQPAVGREIDPRAVGADKLQAAAALRRRHQRLRPAVGGHPADLDGVGRRDAADLGHVFGLLARRRRVEQDGVELVGRRPGQKRDPRSVGGEDRVEVVALVRGERPHGAARRRHALDVAAGGGPGHVGDRLAVGRPRRHELAFLGGGQATRRAARTRP